MKKKPILFMLMLFASCAVQKDVIGRYGRSAKDFSYQLQLESDSTFLFTKSYFEASSKISGRWGYAKKGTIILRSSPKNNISSLISSGHSNDSVQIITVLNGNKIRLNNQILVRDK